MPKKNVWGVNLLNLHFHRNAERGGERIEVKAADELINFSNFACWPVYSCALPDFSVKILAQYTHTIRLHDNAIQYIFFSHIRSLAHILKFCNITCVIYSVF